METKRILIEQLSGAALHYVFGELMKGRIMDCRVRDDGELRAIVAAHNPSGYVEVPADLVETE